MDIGKRVASIVCVALVFAACQGKVADPANDSETIDGQGVEIVEAGLDYRTATTKLWVKHAPGVGPAEQVTWDLSLNGDTVADLKVTLGAAYCCGDYDRYTVAPVAPSTEVSCSGYVQDRGYDAQTDTTSLTVSTRCVWPFSDPPKVRMTAETRSGRYSSDVTDWTGQVLAS